MEFGAPLIRGVFLRRYKRFFADVCIDTGEVVTAHCPNTGSMKSCLEEGQIVYLLKNDDPKRKLKYTWELSEVDGGYVCINTQRPNKIVEEAICKQLIPELVGYETMKREVKYGADSRIDIFLSDSRKPDCYVEVKNVTLKVDGQARFPDAVTSRGTKHLDELVEMVKLGNRAVMFYLVNRPDVRGFNIAYDLDPTYGKAFKRALKNGVEVLVYQTQSTPKEIRIEKAIAFV